MPGSAISSSHSSATSSRRGRTKNYRVVSNTSQVDESLFGIPNHVKQREGMMNEKRDGGEMTIQMMAEERSANRKNKNGKNGRKGKETVEVITKDLIRKLIVPTDDPSGQSVVLGRLEFERIRHAARVLSRFQKDSIQENTKQVKELNMDACTERKNFMKTMDLARQKNEKLNDLEEEAKEKAQHLLSKANEMRQEEEDEIKHLNELILNAKCHAIRDAQLLEKRQIYGEMGHEDKRLDVMMEVDRQNAIKIQEEIEKKRKEERLLGASKLLEQIQENEQERLFELERKDQENIQMQKYVEKMMIEDQGKLEQKHKEQTSLRDELNQANQEMLKRKDLKLQQEQVEELKVVEYMKQKAERDSAFEKEQERIRVEKEKEVARLRALQERVRDEQAERDALRAKRAQEQAEREWRKKEATEAEKKSETESMLKQARSNQMAHKEHFLAVEAHRERVEFERVLKAQKELIEKEKREETVHTQKRLGHAEEVRRQIRQKEQERIAERNQFFEEGVKLDEEARLRRQKLDDVKQKKLNSLRNVGIPEKYLSQVERKINQHSQLAV